MNTDPNAISAEMQEHLNQPIDNPHGLDSETLDFIVSVMKKIYANEIDLYQSSSLINKPLYDVASELAMGKADMLAISLCSKLRELKTLMEISGGDQLFIKPSYQASLLVQDIKYQKEIFEQQYGDLFII